MKYLGIIFITIFTINLYGEKESYSHMKSEAERIYQNVVKIEKQVGLKSESAEKDGDFNLKICIDDNLSIIRGIAESILSSKQRVNSLIEIDKYESVKSQIILVRGLFSWVRLWIVKAL